MIASSKLRPTLSASHLKFETYCVTLIKLLKEKMGVKKKKQKENTSQQYKQFVTPSNSKIDLISFNMSAPTIPANFNPPIKHYP